MCGKGLLIRRPEHRLLRSPVATPPRFVAPRWLNNNAYCTPVKNQGRTSMCAAFGMIGYLEADWWRQHGTIRLFDETALYQTAKQLDGHPNEDGTDLESVITAAEKLFDISIKEHIVSDAADYPFAVHRYGMVLMGLVISNGWMPGHLNPDNTIAPSNTDEGGHAVLGVAYDQIDGTVLCKNSWGDGWGINGYGRMTQQIFENQFQYGYALTVEWPI